MDRKRFRFLSIVAMGIKGGRSRLGSFAVVLCVMAMCVTIYISTSSYFMLDFRYIGLDQNQKHSSSSKESRGGDSSSSSSSLSSPSHMNWMLEQQHILKTNRYRNGALNASVRVGAGMGFLLEEDLFRPESTINVWDLYPPDGNCPDLTRVGHDGDGGKWLCGYNFLQTRKHCNVFSYGASNDVSFEQQLMKVSLCFSDIAFSLNFQSIRLCNIQTTREYHILTHTHLFIYFSILYSPTITTQPPDVELYSARIRPLRGRAGRVLRGTGLLRSSPPWDHLQWQQER